MIGEGTLILFRHGALLNVPHLRRTLSVSDAYDGIAA
jgi:hypothetical protein